MFLSKCSRMGGGNVFFFCVSLQCLIVCKTLNFLCSIGANLQDVFEETWNPFKPSRDTGTNRGEEARYSGTIQFLKTFHALNCCRVDLSEYLAVGIQAFEGTRGQGTMSD